LVNPADRQKQAPTQATISEKTFEKRFTPWKYSANWRQLNRAFSALTVQQRFFGNRIGVLKIGGVLLCEIKCKSKENKQKSNDTSEE